MQYNYSWYQRIRISESLKNRWVVDVHWSLARHNAEVSEAYEPEHFRSIYIIYCNPSILQSHLRTLTASNALGSLLFEHTGGTTYSKVELDLTSDINGINNMHLNRNSMRLSASAPQ